MKTPSPRKLKRLILAGGGHSHIEVLRRFAQSPDSLTEIVVLSPQREALYSGMLPGFVAGQYSWSEIVVDISAVALQARAIFISEPLERIQAADQRVLFGNGSLSYDILVEVDEHDRHLGALPALGVQGLLEAIAKERAVG